MEARASVKGVQISPQKVRLVLDVIRGKPVDEAEAILRYLPHKAAGLVGKVLKSAVANADNNYNLDIAELYVSHASADGAGMLKRWRPRARGRVNRILKRSSHITLAVREKGA
ncbi:MAG: 50S ribosomal protein L22 [Chloroflexi bacterium]|nr:50S ribosomal protein L22 [Chloroflexota bacterium]